MLLTKYEILGPGGGYLENYIYKIVPECEKVEEKDQMMGLLDGDRKQHGSVNGKKIELD